MLQPSTLAYLKKLRKNNNREWFQANRNLFEAAQEDYLEFTAKVIRECGKLDPEMAALSPKECVFRIYRDVRFSNDKTPYKTHFSSQLKAGGKKSGNAGIYIHIEPDGKEGSFVAGGFWLPEAPLLKSIRQEIEYNTEEFKTILNDKKFKKTFGEMEEHKLSRVPKGVEKDHPAAELLKHTSFIVSAPIETKELSSPSLAKRIAKDYLVMKPFLDFLNRVRH